MAVSERDGRKADVGGQATELANLRVQLQREIAQRGEVERERTALETQLVHAQRLEAIGHIAGAVAHDFNNLLTAILGNAELIQERLRQLPLHDETLTRAAEQIGDVAQRAATLTTQLLTFTRRDDIEPHAIHVREILANLERILRRLVGKRITLDLRLDPQCPCVQADAGQIEQVIMNLVLNARDAMPSGGRLTIETGCRVLDASHCAEHPGAAPGPHVFLSVRDTGSGIDPAIATRIFEPFFTTKPAGRGTGLGLPMARTIIEQLHGHITLTSDVGQGAHFQIYLPAAVPGGATGAGVGGADDESAGTVLLCEDDDEVRALTSRMLVSQGYTVLAAESGARALEHVSGYLSPINLLLTDLVLPDTDGRRLAEAVRSRCPDIRVLFVSGYGALAPDGGGSLDAENVLAKPFTRATLLKSVQAAIRGA